MSALGEAFGIQRAEPFEKKIVSPPGRGQGERVSS